MMQPVRYERPLGVVCDVRELGEELSAWYEHDRQRHKKPREDPAPRGGRNEDGTFPTACHSLEHGRQPPLESRRDDLLNDVTASRRRLEDKGREVHESRQSLSGRVETLGELGPGADVRVERGILGLQGQQIPAAEAEH